MREKAGVEEPPKFFQHLNAVGYLVKRTLLADWEYPKSYIHTIGDFLSRCVETAGDDSFVNVISKHKSRKGLPAAKLEIVALDPSKITTPVFSSVHSNMLISGTPQPLEAYAQITKLPADT